jgi:Rrf2 family protein
VNSEFSIAVHSLVLLAHRTDHMASSELIAQNVCTHPARVRKVMSILKKHGFVSTKEGLGGGYILSCDPETTDLGRIYRAVSAGTLKPAWCSGDPETGCMIASNVQTVMDGLFQEAENHLEAYWKRWTVTDVLRQICALHHSKGEPQNLT